MIMPRGQQLLLPVNTFFMWGSLFAALLLSMLPFGRTPWMPDVLALVLVFWSIHQPHRIGMLTAFFVGLLVDVHQSAMLGQHALAYTVLSFLALAIHRRVVWYNDFSQALQILPLFVVSHATELMVRLIAGGVFPGYSLGFAPLLEALLWPLASVVLFAPQRRAPDRDAHRPL
jgi:rod shape-determining protein MreD